jgi:hypothetical protein
LNNKIEKYNLKTADLLKMTDDEIRKRFKNAGAILEMKIKTIITKTEQKSIDFMKKYIKCPKCSSPIDKFEG